MVTTSHCSRGLFQICQDSPWTLYEIIISYRINRNISNKYFVSIIFSAFEHVLFTHVYIAYVRRSISSTVDFLLWPVDPFEAQLEFVIFGDDTRCHGSLLSSGMKLRRFQAWFNRVQRCQDASKSGSKRDTALQNNIHDKQDVRYCLLQRRKCFTLAWDFGCESIT